MKNKFKFLLSEGLKKKFNTKAFKIINIFLFIIIVGLINVDSVIKAFGGDFDEEVNIYIMDEVGVKDELETIISNSYLDVLDSYNAKISTTDKSLEELKTYETSKNIPLTSTGHVRRELKEILSKNWEYKAKVKSCYNIDGHIYNLLISAFCGRLCSCKFFIYRRNYKKCVKF